MSSKARSQTMQSARPQSQDYRRQKPHHTHFLDDYQPSLFVSPIDCDVSRGFLLDYFEQFGRVRSATVKQGKFQDFAIIHFDHWHLQFSERLREDLYNGIPAKLVYEDRRRERHNWKVVEYKERERPARYSNVKPAAPATKAPATAVKEIKTAPAPMAEELRMAKSTEPALKVEKSLPNGRKTRFSPKVEVVPAPAPAPAPALQSEEFLSEELDLAADFLTKTFSQLNLTSRRGEQFEADCPEFSRGNVQEKQEEEEEEDTPVYERFSTDNPCEEVIFKVDYGEVPPARKRGRKIIIKRL